MKEESMTELERLQAAEARVLVPTYDRNPVCFERGEGVHLIDEHGARYLDMLSGIGVNALGYGHPAIEEAIREQSRKLIHISNLYFHRGQAALAERLVKLTGLDRVFFANTGTEAWEGALKFARAHAGRLRDEGKAIGTKFLAVEQSFHGRTFGSVATTHKKKYREPFEPVMPGVEFVRFNDVSDLRTKFSDEVCAVLVESIQGEGGIRPLSAEFAHAARELTRTPGALLVVDEIQVGMGRTGRWFGYQHLGIVPDMTTIAKPLAGGIPLGAIVCTDEVARAIHPGMHGTTFGGGPLACAVAIAVIDAIEREGLLTHATEVGGYFQDRLRGLQKRHPSIVEVRGMGLMVAAELDSAELGKQVVQRMLERRILINCTSETVLRFLPPLVVTKAHVDEVVEALDAILSEAVAENAAQTAGGKSNG